jgi:hypothetical protein
MFQGKTIWLAFNTASGSNSEAALRALDEAFAEAGCTIARRICFPDDDAPDIAELRREGVDMLAIFTGDGTVNAIVTGLYGWEGAVLVLPGGTMNILAHRLHGEAEPVDIIAKVGAGKARTTRPTLIRSRHGDGLSGILAGPGVAWGEVREAMRDVDVLGTIMGAAEAIGESTGGARVHCREPDCGRPEGYSAIQVSPVTDGLAVEGFYAETVADYAKQGLALLRRNFREGPHDDLGLHRSVRLACPERETMGLLIDGEAVDEDAGSTPANEETFTLARCEVDLLATADDG